jgi:hypothetical protein
MSSPKLIRIVHKNDLSTYLSNWKTTMNMMSDAISRRLSKEEGEHYRIARIPKPFKSFSSNSYDLSLVLSYLDNRLRILEDTPITPPQFPYQSYAEAKVFLKVCYIFFLVLLDDVAGIIEYFYKKNEPTVGVKKTFHHLLTKANNDEISDKKLSGLIKELNSWFPEVQSRRDDLVHKYENLQIFLTQNSDGRNIAEQFSTNEIHTRDYKDIRQYFGFILCEYQKFIDSLLDHFDNKFEDWYRAGRGKSSRNTSIIVGDAGIILWWAYRYGNYRNENLQVIESYDENSDG